ncbi:MAG: hypothetical protein ACLGIK_05675 [Gemmatimonadota bacterium]
MTLAHLQSAIADLVCDEIDLRAFLEGPDSWVKGRRLGEHEAKLLREIDPSAMQAFHDIHARDRAYFIEAVLPLTTSRLGEGWSSSYFRAHPFGDDDVQVEADRFAHHLAQQDDDATACLARFEVAKFNLLDEPVFDPGDPLRIRAPRPAALAHGIAVVEASWHLPSLVEDPHAHPIPRRGVSLLRRDADGVTSAWLEGIEADLLAAIARKDHTGLTKLTTTPDGRRAFIQIVGEGILQ